MINAPTISTARLKLRAHRQGDFDAYAAAYGDARMVHMGGPLDQRESWAAFCRDVAQWPLLGHGAWAVDDRETGTFLGQVGLNKHPYFPECELGWLVLPAAEGKGIAFEAAAAARDWARNTLKPASLVSYIHRDNARSIKLAERLGASHDADAPACPYADHLTYRHPMGEAA